MMRLHLSGRAERSADERRHKKRQLWQTSTQLGLNKIQAAAGALLLEMLAIFGALTAGSLCGALLVLPFVVAFFWLAT